MARDEQVLLMSDRFQAYELKSLVRKPVVQALPVTAAVEAPVPVSPDGTLEAHVLYEASDDATARYQLPRYEFNQVAGRHTSRLRLRTADEDPLGPLGWLSIELLAVPPVDARFALRPIEHTAELRLGYEMPVVSETADVAPWDGQWENVDPATRGMTRLVIGQRADGQWFMHGFGKCHPTDCDWGETPAVLSGDALIGVYAFGFKSTTITARRSGLTLVADVFDDYTDADGRADRSSQYVLSRTAAAAAAQPLIWEPLGPLNPVGQQVSRCVLPFHAQEDYDRTYQIITSPAHRARLEVVCKATVGQRSWQQWWLRDRAQPQPVRPDLNRIQVSPQVLTELRRGLATPMVVPIVPVAPAPPSPLHPVHPVPLGGVHVLPRTATMAAPAMVRMARAPLLHQTPATLTVPMMAATPTATLLRVDHDSMASLVLREGVSPPLRTLPNGTRPQGANPRVIKALPRRVVVDKQGRPVLVRREVECVQSLPFTLDPQTEGYMLDAPVDATQAHVLFKHDLSAGGLSVSFFQDSLVRDQVYYEPQEFRLARSDSNPFLPSLVFAITDVVTESEALAYRVRLAFQARPYLGEAFTLLAQQHFGRGVRLTALTPRSAELSLNVPPAEGATAEPQDRPDAVIRFDEGVTDEISLDEAQFVRLAAAFQSPSGIGLQGWVSATLSDGSQVDIPLVVSLKENAGSPFDAPMLHPDADGTLGHYTVTLRNRIESPVRVNAALPLALGDWTDPASGETHAVTAFPVDPPAAEPVPPGGTAQLRYAVTPAAFPLLSIEPALDLDILPDLARLLGQLTVTEAFTDATFEVQASASPLFFGSDALSALRIEFDDGPVVTLDAAHLSQTVALRKPVLARILGLDPGYRYRLVQVDAQGGERATEGLSGVGHLQVSLPQG